MRKFMYVFMSVLTIALCLFTLCFLFISEYEAKRKSKEIKEVLDEIEASRFNSFIDAGLTVYADEVPVDKVTAQIVSATDTFRIGDTEYGIEPLLDEGYVMLIDGAIEPSEKATLEVLMATYYAYEVRSSDRVIVLKKR